MKLSPTEQEVWLLQHIPHRICAISTWLELRGDWTMLRASYLPLHSDFHTWCIGRSVDEGRFAATRWLIEFVGIKMHRKRRRADRPKPIQGQEDEFVSIKKFHKGRLFPLRTRKSLILARVWKGCTQCSVHPTRDTSYPDVSPQKLAEALELMLTHLHESLYAPNRLGLLSVIRAQERRAAIAKLFPRSWARRFRQALEQEAKNSNSASINPIKIPARSAPVAGTGGVASCPRRSSEKNDSIPPANSPVAGPPK